MLNYKNYKGQNINCTAQYYKSDGLMSSQNYSTPPNHKSQKHTWRYIISDTWNLFTCIYTLEG
jgi:dihydrodipicolinate synthase/N-acetylneuraminate lyase